jgi:hypothetical protein
MNISTPKVTNQYVGEAKFVVIDETRHTHIPLNEPFDGKNITMTPEYPNDLMCKHGFKVYTGPKLVVRQYIAASPDRYKLFESEPMDIMVRGPGFRMVLKRFRPWKIVVKKEQVGQHKDTGELIFEDKVSWIEVPDYEPKDKK